MAVVSIDELKKKYAQEVELPGFDGTEAITVLLKRPSLMEMAASGKIRNDLLGAVAELFNEGITQVDSGKKFKELSDAMVEVAKAALVSPTYKEITDAGMSLTDQQLIFIHSFVNTGVDRLASFREKAGSGQDNQSK